MSGMTDMTSTSNSTMMSKMYIHGSIGSDTLWFNSWVPTSAGATVGVCIGLFLLAVFDRYLSAFRRACDVAWNEGHIGFAIPKSNGTFTFASSLPFRSASRRAAPSDSLKPNTALPSSSSSSAETPSSEDAAAVPLYTDRATGEVEEDEKNYAHLPRAVRRSLRNGQCDARAGVVGRWSRPFRWQIDVPRGAMHALQVSLQFIIMLVIMTFQLWWIISIVVGEGVGEALFGRFGAAHAGHSYDGHFV